MKTKSIIFLLFCLMLSLTALVSSQEANTFAVKNCRIFNGENMQYGSLLIQKGIIEAVGKEIDIPKSIQVIDGTGKTIMPGLIDSHVHIWNEYQLEQSLIFGVTFVIDMFMDPEIMTALKTRLANPDVNYLAGLISPGILATSPDGHGTQFGVEVPALTNPAQAQQFVGDRIAEGSDFIKIICEDGDDNYKFPTLDMEIIKALIIAAHERGLLAVVHILDLDDAVAVIKAGADGLAHLFASGGYDPNFGKLAADHNIFVIPTFSVLQSLCGVGDIKDLISDENLAPYLTVADKLMLERTFPNPAGEKAYSDAERAMRQLHEENVPILAGTDAPNPGTTYGPSLHRELELLVKAGLTPLEALKAATSIPARKFKIKNRGFIKKGMAADLLLVEGDPSINIKATRNITAVWKNGFMVDRETHRAEIAE